MPHKSTCIPACDYFGHFVHSASQSDVRGGVSDPMHVLLCSCEGDGRRGGPENVFPPSSSSLATTFPVQPGWDTFNEDNNGDEPEMSAVIVHTRSVAGLITLPLRGRCSQFSRICRKESRARRHAGLLLLTSRVWICLRCIAAAAHPLTRRDSEKIVLERQGNSCH